jgi:hypothetical protein
MSKLKALLRNSSIYFQLELNPVRWYIGGAQVNGPDAFLSSFTVGPIGLDVYIDWSDEDIVIIRSTDYVAAED